MTQEEYGEYVRRTVTIHKVLYNRIQSERANFLKKGEEMSFTTALNMILLGGIIGSEKFYREDWITIANFIEEQKVKLNLLSLKDQYAEYVLEKEVKKGKLKK